MNPRINPDTFYVNGNPIPATYFQAVDAAQCRAINWDAGGTWTPSSPIVLGGSGLAIAGPSTVSGGSTIVTPSGSGMRVVLGTNDAIGLASGHAAATRVIHSSCGQFFDASGGTSVGAKYSATYDGAVGSGTGCRFVVPIRTHNWATFQQAVLTVIVAGSVGRTLPTAQPKIRFYGVSSAGVLIPLATTSGLEAGGWVQFALSSGAYGGSTVTLTYTMDPSIVVDSGLFSYMAEIVDESGSNAIGGNIYTDIACTFTSIPDMGFS